MFRGFYKVPNAWVTRPKLEGSIAEIEPSFLRVNYSRKKLKKISLWSGPLYEDRAQKNID